MCVRTRKYLIMNLFAVILLFVIDAASALNLRHAIVVDAGSTGNRAFLFLVPNDDDDSRVIPIKRISNEGGIAEFVENPSMSYTLILPLINQLLELVPDQNRPAVKFYVRATGGMRMLSESDQFKIWDALFNSLVNFNLPISIARENFGTITGDLEAYYAVVSANYLAGRIDNELKPISGAKIIGALDMGGSSTQMIYHYGSSTVEMNDFWSNSWQNYGLNSVLDKLLKHLLENGKSLLLENVDGNLNTPNVIQNPCGFKGHVEQFENVALLGIGNATECRTLIDTVLWGDDRKTCQYNENNACIAKSLNGVELVFPLVDEFHAMSAYQFVFDCIRVLGHYELRNW